MKTKYTILQDQREKRPLLFPKHLVVGDGITADSLRTVTLTVEKAHLETSDYTISDGIVPWSKSGVERKMGLREVHNNIYGARGRYNFEHALARMREAFKYPHLVWELPVPTAKDAITYAGASDGLLALCSRHGVALHIFSASGFNGRRHAGELVARLLLNPEILESPSWQIPLPS